MTQPLFSGAPQPVQGVTGGPAVLGGQIGNDPNTGNVVINPAPGNAVEIRKSPSAFNVYEYFNSNTDNVHITLATALGGPETIGVIAAPSTVSRDLQIVTSGSGHVLIPQLQLSLASASLLAPVSIPNTAATVINTFGAFVNPQPANFTVDATGITVMNAGYYLCIAYAFYNTSAGGTSRQINIYNVTTSAQILSGTANPVSSAQGAQGQSIIMQSLSAGTKVSLQTFQDSGAALNLLAAFIQVLKVGTL
jgi:hypothetical protein